MLLAEINKCVVYSEANECRFNNDGKESSKYGPKNYNCIRYIKFGESGKLLKHCNKNILEINLIQNDPITFSSQIIVDVGIRTTCH